MLECYTKFFLANMTAFRKTMKKRIVKEKLHTHTYTYKQLNNKDNNVYKSVHLPYTSNL